MGAAQNRGDGTGLERIIGESAAMSRVREVMKRLARNDATVLITGETGTGKELVARAIHDLGPRNGKPFVAVNMSAIPRDLVESELFGHAAGAFTGARGAREGRFEAAAGGTIFFDEIGDVPLETQVKLLRVLQEHAFERVGENQPRPASARIISATHQDLEGLIASGRFREDLYYRLNVVHIEIPPLRERIEDIPMLAEHFLQKTARRYGMQVTLDESAIEALSRYHWPGNVRELEHAIERAVALSPEGDPIRPAVAIPRRRQTQIAGWVDEMLSEDVGIDEVIAAIERHVLTVTLAQCNGNQTLAARKLKLARQTLQARLKKYKIEE